MGQVKARLLITVYLSDDDNPDQIEEWVGTTLEANPLPTHPIFTVRRLAGDTEEAK